VKRSFRLTRTTDFKRVRLIGRSYAHPLVVLITAQNSLQTKRVGVTTSRSISRAVDRNRAKRRVRACVDKILADLNPGWDIIFVARPPIRKATFEEIEKAVVSGLLKSKLIKKSDG
jgi:ribonuclease P protein component